jgi:hypothetical protein
MVTAIPSDRCPCKASQPVARRSKRPNRQQASGTPGLLVYRHVGKIGGRPVVADRISSQFSRRRGDALHLQTQGDRSSPPPKSCRGPNTEGPWQGVWVAGLCSSTQVRPRGLFYLMLVETTCGSHAGAWKTLESPVPKSAHLDRFGDVYEPRQTPSPHP